jgi:hypothetical protein
MARRQLIRKSIAPPAVLNREVIRSAFNDALTISLPNDQAVARVLRCIPGATQEQIVAGALALLWAQQDDIMELEDEIERQGADLYREIGNLRAHLCGVSERLGRLPDHSNGSGGSTP